MRQPMCIAEHIAAFTGKKVKFREQKYLKFLRRRRKTAPRKPDNNKPTAID